MGVAQTRQSNQGSPMRRALPAVLAALALAACQHRHPLTDEALSEFRQGGDKAILAVDGDMTAFGCGSARYNFINLSDRSKVSVKSEAGAGISIVTPGRYRLDTLYCAVWGTGGWDIPANDWFSVVDVKPGEVVYLGTIVVIPFSDTVSGSMLQTPDLKAAWGLAPTYTMRDEFDAALKVLRPEVGDLADRMVARPLGLLLSEREFADAVERAYRPVNGVMPSHTEARASVAAELDRIFRAQKPLAKR